MQLPPVVPLPEVVELPLVPLPEVVPLELAVLVAVVPMVPLAEALAALETAEVDDLPVVADVEPAVAVEEVPVPVEALPEVALAVACPVPEAAAELTLEAELLAEVEV